MGANLPLGRRKSSYSNKIGGCVELGAVWRKSSFSGATGDCVELGDFGAVRDSKNPAGPRISVDLDSLVRWVKTDR